MPPALQQIRQTSADELASLSLSLSFSDARLDEMLFRYRARNFPQTLSADELADWQIYRKQRLTNKNGGGSIVLDAYTLKINELLADESLTQEKQAVLNDLMKYADQLELMD